MKVFIASDHGGFSLKKEVMDLLKELKVPFEDLGCHSDKSVDYPDYASLVAEKVSQTDQSRGILVCGTGIGMAISANKFKGVRAAVVSDSYSTRMCREHNDANVLCLGGRVVGPSLAEEIVKVFLNTPFTGDRHEKRVNKIKEIEEKNLKR